MSLIEKAMNGLISLYFFNDNANNKFISELLQEQYFSFELRKRIFKRIFEKKYPESKFPWSSLNEMQRIRNIVAHGRIDQQFLLDNASGEKIELNEPYYQYHTEEKNAASLHNEFQEHMKNVATACNQIHLDTGIHFNEEPLINI